MTVHIKQEHLRTMAEGRGEPALKKKKLEEVDPVFISFEKDKKSKLDRCRQAIVNGTDYMNLVFLKVLYADARTQMRFSRATCCTEVLKWSEDSDDTEAEVNCVIGSIFVEGLDILDKYFNQAKIPCDPQLQAALAKLLKFFHEDHSPLLEDMTDRSDGEWALIAAQHLLIKLSIEELYCIAPYKACRHSACPCAHHDKLVGYTGDTSFGLKKGWHGETDIIIDDIVVTVQEGDIPEPELKPTVDEIKRDGAFSRESESQLKAQTITFSHLQARFNRFHRNSLIPGIAINTKYVLINFYDSENDVLLTSSALPLFANKTLKFSTVLFLWLTLNYKLLCSGLTEEMKRYKSNFFNMVDIDSFREQIERPLHIKPSEEMECGPCSFTNPGHQWATKPSSVSEYIDLLATC